MATPKTNPISIMRWEYSTCSIFTALSFLLLSILALGNANTLQGTIDTKRLQAILQDGIKSMDISTLYYSVKGLKQLNVKVPDICQVRAFLYSFKTYYIIIVIDRKKIIYSYTDINTQPCTNVMY